MATNTMTTGNWSTGTTTATTIPFTIASGVSVPPYFLRNLTREEWERKAWIENGIQLSGAEVAQMFWEPPASPFAIKTGKDLPVEEKEAPHKPPYSELENVVNLQMAVITGLRSELRKVYAELGLSEEEISSLMQTVSPSSGKYL